MTSSIFAPLLTRQLRWALSASYLLSSPLSSNSNNSLTCGPCGESVFDRVCSGGDGRASCPHPLLLAPIGSRQLSLTRRTSCRQSTVSLLRISARMRARSTFEDAIRSLWFDEMNLYYVSISDVSLAAASNTDLCRLAPPHHRVRHLSLLVVTRQTGTPVRRGADATVADAVGFSTSIVASLPRLRTGPFSQLSSSARCAWVPSSCLLRASASTSLTKARKGGSCDGGADLHMMLTQ